MTVNNATMIAPTAQTAGQEKQIVPYPAPFFAQETLTVARALIGQTLWHAAPGAQQWQAYRIVETEAYTQDDPACHAYQGNKGRATTLYGPPGLAYVYLIYGMYHCLNVVTEPDGTAGAVLFRALEPLSSSANSATVPNTKGPGRLCKALGITRAAHNAIDLTQVSSGLFLAPSVSTEAVSVITAPRIGITQATDAPWRFCLAGSNWLSVKPPASSTVTKGNLHS